MRSIVFSVVLFAMLAVATSAGIVACPSPCANATLHLSPHEVRARLKQVAMDGYTGRAHEHYSENMTLRWTGIHDHVCPPNVPTYSDCSSFVTWVYWTLFGAGTDFLNGERWAAGYTGTLKAHGRAVVPGANATNLLPGDLCFYYHPMHHVAMYVGNAKVVTHGFDPVGHFPWDYAPVDYCRRYIEDA